MNEWLYSFHFDKIRERLPNLSKVKVLEVGSQSAGTSCLLAKHGARVYCIDNEAEELAKGINLFKRQGVKGEFKLMNGFDLEFDDNFFDIVFNQGVVEHYQKIEQDELLQEMKRVSKKLVYVSVPNKFHPRTMEIERSTTKEFEWEKEFYPFSFIELRNLFERNELKVIELFGSFHWIDSDLLRRTIGLLLSYELCVLGKLN